MSTQITSGTFTSVASTPYFLPLSQQIDRFILVNKTKLESYTSGRITNAEYWRGMSANKAYVDAPTTVSGPLNASAVIRTYLAQGGFTLFDSSTSSYGATIAVSSFNNGTNVFTTGSAHGFVVGDTVELFSFGVAKQLNGIYATVTAVGSTTTFTTLFSLSGVTTDTGSVRKVGNYLVQNSSLYYPQNRRIAAISAANPMVVTLLVQQNYQVGDVVRFMIPTAYGMQQLNSTSNGLPLEFTISAVNNAVGTQTVTFGNVDASAYTAFAYASATSYPYGPAVMIPQGEGNLNQLTGVVPAPLPYANQDILGFARQNTGARGIIIGAGDGTAAASTGGIIGAAAEVFYWECHTSLQTFGY